MTAERIAEIRAREQAATPGRWGTEYDGEGTYYVHARLRTTPEEGMASDGVVAELHGEHGDGQAYANARFTAHARADVPFLLDRVAVLEELVKQLADPDPCWFDHHGHCQAHGWPYTEPSCPNGRAQKLFPETKES
jgi:alpha-ketoglutarate-dependent taurine dioxygenase